MSDLPTLKDLGWHVRKAWDKEKLYTENDIKEMARKWIRSMVTQSEMQTKMIIAIMFNLEKD